MGMIYWHTFPGGLGFIVGQVCFSKSDFFPGANHFQLLYVHF